ncbi:hypothetical protein BXO88_11770 [Oribacterium sp. C9]|uniref:LysR family transcriptional regulator n=1 Tax=Oribacterium sp. C9 TaxID=1943579 RepID=UPI00098F89AE|nr:LysR family transcriptional regulator [Oribacterium sp. C9]OON85602.1 hypothetical protein BXO88_11770 [Oribacterium sp. C9]
MDLQSFYYFQEVAKDLNITKTANRLFISQQTLSNHIKRLEEYFDTPLLHRKPKLSLTYAGEFVLSFSNYVSNKERNLNDVMMDIRNVDKGLLRFGASVMRTSLVLSHILELFSEKFPKVELRISNFNSQLCLNSILDGNLDLALVLFHRNGEKNFDKDLNYIHLIDEEIYLCVTDELLERYYGDDAKELKKKSKDGARLENFSRLPFAMLNNHMGRTIDFCFNEAGFTPKVRALSSNLQITSTFGVKGLAACFVSKSSVLTYISDFKRDDINFFPLLLDNEVLCQKCYLIHRKDRYLSQYTKMFSELLIRFFTFIGKLSMDEIIHEEGLSGLHPYLAAEYES